MVQLNIGVHGDDAAAGIHVGDGVVGFDDRLLGGRSLGGVEVLKGAEVTAVGHLIGQVGGDKVDGVGGFVAHIGAGLLGYGDQVLGGDHVLRVVQVDQADGGLIGHGKDQVLRALDGDVLGAGDVLHIPGFGVVRDEDAGAGLGAHVGVDAQQQLDRFLGGGGLTQQDGGDLRLFNAGLLVEGVDLLDQLGAAADGLGGGDGHALLIGAGGAVGVVLVGAAAVGAHIADRRAVVVAHGVERIGIMGEGVGEAVAAGVRFAGLEGAGFIDEHDLVVAVGDILGAAEHGRAVGSQAGADIHGGAGHGAGGEAEHQREQQGDHGLGLHKHNGYHPFRIFIRCCVDDMHYIAYLCIMQAYLRIFIVFPLYFPGPQKHRITIKKRGAMVSHSPAVLHIYFSSGNLY